MQLLAGALVVAELFERVGRGEQHEIVGRVWEADVEEARLLAGSAVALVRSQNGGFARLGGVGLGWGQGHVCYVAREAAVAGAVVGTAG